MSALDRFEVHMPPGGNFSLEDVGRLAAAHNVTSLAALNLSLADLDLDLELDLDLAIVPESVQRWLIALFSTTAALSLLANLIVILVLLLGKRSGDLRAFLINLALCDITMAVFSIPFSYTSFLLGRWVFPTPLCPVVNTMQVLAVVASVYTLLAVGIDRYNAVLHPFSRHVTKWATKWVVSAIWLLAAAASGVQMFVSSAEPIGFSKQLYACAERWPSARASQAYTVAIFSLTFALPLTTLGYVYVSIAVELWRSAPPGNADAARDSNQLRNKKKVIKMMMSIVIAFAACWLPLQLFNVLLAFRPELGSFHTPLQRRLLAATFFACLWLANVNSLVNPLLYSFMSDTFLTELKDVLLRRPGRLRAQLSKSSRSTRCSRSGSARGASTQASLLRRAAPAKGSIDIKHIDLVEEV